MVRSFGEAGPAHADAVAEVEGGDWVGVSTWPPTLPCTTRPSAPCSGAGNGHRWAFVCCWLFCFVWMRGVGDTSGYMYVAPPPYFHLLDEARRLVLWSVCKQAPLVSPESVCTIEVTAISANMPVTLSLLQFVRTITIRDCLQCPEERAPRLGEGASRLS